MKEITIFLLMIAVQTVMIVQAQTMPDVELKTMNGTSVLSSEILDATAPTVLFFWKEGSNNCNDNLDEMQNIWIEDLQQKGVRMVAVCTDCHGSWSQVKPFANGKNWEFEIFIDPNGELKRSMNISCVPSAMIYDKNQNLLCKQNGINDVDATVLCERIADNIESSAQAEATK